MKEYIEREKALDAQNKSMNLNEMRERLKRIPAADVREVVTCGECVYWQKPQVWQNDGTFRDYQPGEYESGGSFGGVSIEVGVNFGSFCALYDREHKNELPQFMNENDFCSKGYKAEAGE